LKNRIPPCNGVLQNTVEGFQNSYHTELVFKKFTTQQYSKALVSMNPTSKSQLLPRHRTSAAGTLSSSFKSLCVCGPQTAKRMNFR
jgi:hypothetical protein